jgi:transcriptional regulator with XRE-family HTH domain
MRGVPKLFGEVLRAIRVSAGLSIRDLARVTGIATGQLSQLETGVKRDPTFTTACNIARALGVSLDDFDRACNQSETPPASVKAAEEIEMRRELENATDEAEKLTQRLRAIISKKSSS